MKNLDKFEDNLCSHLSELENLLSVKLEAKLSKFLWKPLYNRLDIELLFNHVMIRIRTK